MAQSFLPSTTGWLKRPDNTVDCGYMYSDIALATKIRLSFWLAGVRYRRYRDARGVVVWSKEVCGTPLVYATITTRDEVVLPAQDQPL